MGVYEQVLGNQADRLGSATIPSPIKIGAGVDQAMGTAMQTVDNVGKAQQMAKAQQFQTILDQGYKGMVQAYTEARAAGINVIDPSYFQDKPEEWYKELANKVNTAQAGKQLGAGDITGAMATSVAGGLDKPTDAAQVLTKENLKAISTPGKDAFAKAEQLRTAKENDLGRDTSTKEREDILKSVGLPVEDYASTVVSGWLQRGQGSTAGAAKGQTEANVANAEQGGTIPEWADKKLRTPILQPIDKITTAMQDVRDNAIQLREALSQENTSGDIAALFGFMKSLDPKSVVREGEFSTAQNIGGKFENLMAQWAKFSGNGYLTPVQRIELKKTTNALMRAYDEGYHKTIDLYAKRAPAYVGKAGDGAGIVKAYIGDGVDFSVFKDLDIQNKIDAMTPEQKATRQKVLEAKQGK